MWLWKRKRKSERQHQEGLEGLPVIRKVLLIAGGSSTALSAARFALQFSNQTGAHVLAAYVVDTDSLDLLQNKGIFIDEECREFSADMEEKGSRYLDRIKRFGQELGVTIETELVKGRFVKSVIGLVKAQETDMLIMGGWDSGICAKDMSVRLRQTVADAVECPVVVVK